MWGEQAGSQNTSQTVSDQGPPVGSKAVMNRASPEFDHGWIGVGVGRCAGRRQLYR